MCAIHFYIPRILCLTASPQVTIASVKLEKDHMTVTWSYNGQSSRRKRSTSTNVSVVICYQPDGGEEAHYPLQGSVAAEEPQVTINGQFDDKVKYKVWLKVYEGLLDVSFQQTKPFEAAVEKGAVVIFSFLVVVCAFISLSSLSHIKWTLLEYNDFVKLKQCNYDICSLYKEGLVLIIFKCFGALHNTCYGTGQLTNLDIIPCAGVYGRVIATKYTIADSIPTNSPFVYILTG